MNTGCQIQLLGALRIRVGSGQVVHAPPGKATSLLAYLAYHSQRRHAREALIELLWPECESEVGRSRLSVLLSALRDQLQLSGIDPGAILVSDRFSVGLNANAVTTDAAEFEAVLSAAARAPASEERVRLLSEAVERYRGELLPENYGDWVLPERRRLEELYFQALHHLIGHFERSGKVDRAIQLAHQAVVADPLREDAHRELIRLYAAGGQTRAALQQYHELKRRLRRELNVDPDAATRALVRAIGERKNAASESGTEIPASSLHRPAVSAVPHASAAAPHRPGSPSLPAVRLEPIGGAVPLDSPFYVLRPVDHEFAAAITRQDSIVLVKGPRQVGKTSLLARGVQQAREMGARIVLTDFEIFNAEDLASAETLLLVLARMFADQLDLETLPDEVWDSRRGANLNFRRYLQREVLEKFPEPIVWELDEVDRLFHCDFGSEIFGLFRSWHNQRALDPEGPWSRLTLAMAYATEAHLFVADLHQSPFNVGTQLRLEDFTPEQVADLNRRYGSPLQDPPELGRFYDLLRGHPYLVQAGLYEMAARGTDLATLEARASRDDWVLGNHLKRILVLLTRDAELCGVVRGLLRGEPCPTPRSFYRLQSAGLAVGSSEQDARLRCPLYTAYLKRHLF